MSWTMITKSQKMLILKNNISILKIILNYTNPTLDFLGNYLFCKRIISPVEWLKVELKGYTTVAAKKRIFLSFFQRKEK